jgi:hypothetical protein
MRARTVVVLVTTVLVLAGSALAASAAADPLRLVLQRSDLPAKGTYVNGRLPRIDKALAASGITSSTAFYAHTLQLNSTSHEMISGLVIVLKSAGEARKVYRLTKADLTPEPGGVVRLPAYGDEQVASWTPGVSKADLLVRQGSVVWQLEVDPERLSKLQVLGKLQSYAAKQKRRIGSG